MKFKRFVAAALAVTMGLSGFLTTEAQAANFRDVTTDWNWARESINTVVGLGIMSGDLSGNFNPGNSIDKFETARILARMGGFNPANHTPAQQAYFEQVYQTQRVFIHNFANQFNRWNNAFNRDIAFLLYRGVLQPSDLAQFVVMDGNTERLRALAREELAVFLVRLMGRAQQAHLLTGIAPFNDDAHITPAARAYVYYLRSRGILNGSGGYVSPRAPVNRAAMAVLVESVLHEMNSPLLGGNTSNPNQNTPAFQTIFGTIANTYPSFRSVLITSVNPEHNNRIFPITASAIIQVSHVNRPFADLQQGMDFVATVHNGEIVSINATPATAQPTPTPAPNTPAAQDLRTLDGTVASVSFTSQANVIGVETRTLSPRGDIITEVRNYTLASNATVTRAGTAVSYRTIVVGDLIVAEVYGNTAFTVALQERDRHIFGTLIEKNFSENSFMPSLVVRDSNGTNHTFNVNSSTRISRRNSGIANLNSRDIRIGDTLEVRATWGMATEIFAQGARTSTDVYIRSIFISGREQSFIVTSETAFGTADRQFLLIDGQVDVHSLQIGSRVRLWLDSYEVESVVVLQDTSANNFMGTVTSINHTNSTFVVRDANFNTRTFTFNQSTSFHNAITGNAVNAVNITTNMRVYVVTSATVPNRATSVVVLPH